jgi:intracellular multiplication protein IcmM
MSRETWSLIKQSKRFYVNTFRRAGSALLLSVIINLGLGVAIYYVYFAQPPNDFYATNGVTSPELLTSMDIPNNTSVPMLASDPDVDNTIKVIPQ